MLDAGVPREGNPSALLLEMNVEVEAGRKAMAACDRQMASLRKKHKL